MGSRDNRIIGHLGDVDSVEYGGGKVFTDGFHRWLEYTYGREDESFDDISLEKLQVFQVDIDDDVFDTHDWVNVEGLASYTGIAPEDILLAAKGTVVERAQVLEDIGSYYGWVELDSYPMMLSVQELEDRWKLS